MNPRKLGSLGVQVSEIALGTVELGMDYGFRGSHAYRRPDPDEAVLLLRRAVDLGVNLFDTARAYGESEELIGRALAGVHPRPLIATKLAADRPEAMLATIEASLRALRVEAIDLLQIHNATAATLADGEVLGCLEEARRQGKVRFTGASFYEEDAAYSAVSEVDAIQVAYNLLDQKMARRVLPCAEETGTGVLVRSAFLRGVLTAQVRTLPARLDRLRHAALAALAAVGEPEERLAEVALRFCLGAPGVSSVIVGVRSGAELEANLAAARKGPLPQCELRRFSFEDDPIVNPGTWQDLI